MSCYQDQYQNQPAVCQRDIKILLNEKTTEMLKGNKGPTAISMFVKTEVLI